MTNAIKTKVIRCGIYKKHIDFKDYDFYSLMEYECLMIAGV
ncbi:hypothetical protein QFZ73_003683 [Peribacillus sp. V2I11]|nr:hypothetical protein [Peribacillus sp. V2I11]